MQNLVSIMYEAHAINSRAINLAIIIFVAYYYYN